MVINASSQGFSITKALRQYMSEKIEGRLKKFDHRINGIYVSMMDINGPKGGRDKKCTISIKLKHKKYIVVQETANDMYDAINICAQKAKRATGRQLSKIRWKKTKLEIDSTQDLAFG